MAPETIAFFDTFCRTALAEVCCTETYYTAAGEVASFGIFPGGADKGTALALVLRKLNLSSEAVVAIGDNDHDLPLFAQAGLKVAVGNATVALKQRADVIAPDHDNDGVGWAIEQFVL